MKTELQKQATQEKVGRDIETLHKYIDSVVKRGFFGQLLISWERGRPLHVKETATLCFEDIEKMV